MTTQHSELVKLRDIMNLQYFVPAAFPLPRTKLRSVWIRMNSSCFHICYLRTKYSREPAIFWDNCRKWFFSATHIQTTTYFININRSVDASKTFAQKITS